MLWAMTRTGLTLALERCSRTSVEFCRILKVAAVLLWAATFFTCTAPCHAIDVLGLPEWLSPSVTRSLNAVWEEIPDGVNVDRPGTLQIVADRLFSGYTVEVLPQTLNIDTPVVRMEPKSIPEWLVNLDSANLRPPVSEWFKSDLNGFDKELEALIKALPVEALSWADSALRYTISERLKERLPGWDFSLQVQLSENNGVLNISFRPAVPLVLAITPSLYSATLPLMFQSDLESKIAPGLSSIIGLPVEWVARHRSEIEAFVKDFLRDRNTISNVRARVDVSFTPASIAKAKVDVNSERLLFKIWMAAYVGMEGYPPELGLLLGWNTRHLTGIDLELYGEAVLKLDDFSFDTRLGFRFLLFSALRLGVELEWPEQNTVYRLQWDEYRLKQPFFWLRWAPAWGYEAALGYRFNEHVSLEIYYNDSQNDKLGLRGILSF